MERDGSWTDCRIAGLSSAGKWGSIVRHESSFTDCVRALGDERRAGGGAEGCARGDAGSDAEEGKTTLRGMYAKVMGNVEVQLANGVPWPVKNGEVFPVVMFKEQQTIAVLQLAGTTFRLSTDWLAMIEEKDLTDENVAAYRAALQGYIDKAAEDAKATLPLPK